MARSKAYFGSSVLRTDAFCRLSPKAQLLYIQLSFDADGYGVVSSTRAAQLYADAGAAELSELFKSGYLISVLDCIVIAHWWRSNNLNSEKNMPKSRHDVLQQLSGGADSDDRMYHLSSESGGIQAEVRLKSAANVSKDNPIQTNENSAAGKTEWDKYD